MKKIVILGANGQLGTELVHLLFSTSDTIIALSSAQLDITKRRDVTDKIKEVQPDIIIDAAAYTKVDNAEDIGKTQNWLVNDTGTKNVVDVANSVGAVLVYVSTDYIFDGKSNSEYSESAVPSPLNEYGKAKLAGEKYVSEKSKKGYVVRTSWVYGEYGSNFYFTMLKLAKTHAKLSIVNDQIGRPTWTRDLAKFIYFLISKSTKYGTYNFCNSGTASWFEFARSILENEDIEVDAIASSHFPQKASRPQKNVLSLVKVQSLGYDIPNWQDALHEFESSIGKQ